MAEGRRIRNESDLSRIRNGKIRRDFKRLLTVIADDTCLDYEVLKEVEDIAESHALYFDDEGNVEEAE